MIYISFSCRTSSLNDKHSCQLFRKAASFSSLVLLSSSVSTANLSCLLATTFSSLRFLFNFTSLQSFESGQRGFLFSHFQVLSSILSLSFLCSSVSEALFTLSFSFLSELLFFNQSLPPKNDFEHARGLRNSIYTVNLTYGTYRRISESAEHSSSM